MNLRLFDKYKPKAIIFSGISKRIIEIAQQQYDLIRAGDPLKEENHRLVEHYRDKIRPWIFTKHWSARLSRPQKEKIKIEISRIIQTS